MASQLGLRFVQAPKIPTLRAGPIESAISSREEEERDADTKKSSVIIIYHAIINSLLFAVAGADL